MEINEIILINYLLVSNRFTKLKFLKNVSIDRFLLSGTYLSMRKTSRKKKKISSKRNMPMKTFGGHKFFCVTEISLETVLVPCYTFKRSFLFRLNKRKI